MWQPGPEGYWPSWSCCCFSRSLSERALDRAWFAVALILVMAGLIWLAIHGVFWAMLLVVLGISMFVAGALTEV